jgi:hypothetical protein
MQVISRVLTSGAEYRHVLFKLALLYLFLGPVALAISTALLLHSLFPVIIPRAGIFGTSSITIYTDRLTNSLLRLCVAGLRQSPKGTLHLRPTVTAAPVLTSRYLPVTSAYAKPSKIHRITSASQQLDTKRSLSPLESLSGRSFLASTTTALQTRCSLPYGQPVHRSWI